MCPKNQISFVFMIHILKKIHSFLLLERKKKIPLLPFYLGLLVFTPFICATEDIKSPIQKRREKREEMRTGEHWPQYEGCQDMPGSFFMHDLNSSETETEAIAVCGSHCQRFLSPFGLFKEAAHSVLETDFKKQLKERVPLSN